MHFLVHRPDFEFHVEARGLGDLHHHAGPHVLLEPGLLDRHLVDGGSRQRQGVGALALVTAVVLMPVSTCVTVMPGRTAPVSSVTVPVMAPRMVWASGRLALRTAKSTTARTRRRRCVRGTCMVGPPPGRALLA
jgi:hypothetical protein